MKTHELKIQPEFLAAVKDGKKKAEFRFNDRNFAVGDLLRLSEIDYLQAHGYCGRTGNHVYVQITHITDLAKWAPGYVMLSIERGPFSL
ncbi:DUF3850 domain-containing protein [Serratia proteamaculans]|uniref:DUF3850 domain-containing protein n=1 Tax=Serratia proteamaculans TaxID=28151 RepID=A0ABS0TVM7_SERPR|nr:DUF3850 domain-containing protein [Serratia proteamaculans]MBI6182416.1 DUF3850 domain-containing protein [Serratia proteamaculans]